VRDYAVQAGDILYIKEKDTREEMGLYDPSYYQQEMRRFD
jgi:hypothetical protein